MSFREAASGGDSLRGESGLPGAREQTELGGAADRGAPAGHPELGIDVAGVRPDGRQRHTELSGDVRAAELAREQMQDLEFAFAERLDQWLVRLRARSRTTRKRTFLGLERLPTPSTATSRAR